ncbi:uncharacterized protein LOC117817985 [Notolabrus celidotus]|uniref:uncharacterized protein LOC117817985 n=1 Tax=Notolabrus celidotus TaxID=1203425 RepID=UPI00149011C8|nr:uncharacterized protein LOC117817985 [Notolabrus celidotus]XP_034546706.1 uncharacterized protein LOC117817985 [Notolabrus celidotus]
MIFDSNEAVIEKQTLQLTIQVPVSSIQLASECLSQGEMRVSCSSGGGDSPQYSWTLDGHTLIKSQLLSGNSEDQIITLRQDVLGMLVCTVRNHISSVSDEEKTESCGFEFFDCTLLNGTYISQWLRPSDEIQCVKPALSLDIPLLICVLEAAVFFLIIIGIFLYFAWRKNKLLKGEGSAVPEVVEYENNSVVMVEMRSSAAEH